MGISFTTRIPPPWIRTSREPRTTVSATEIGPSPRSFSAAPAAPSGSSTVPSRWRRWSSLPGARW